MPRLNAFTLACKTLRHNPLAGALNLLLMAIGIGMMTCILSVAQQLEQGALRDADGIDLVVGAKGSPLQLILSSIYQMDVPPGNIPLAAQAQLAAHPMVRSVIPLALGDSFHGFRIVGTSADYLKHYQAKLAQGQFFTAPMQAVFGAQAARDSGAVVGALFAGSHGLTAGGEQHRHAPYTVVGILQPSGGVLDRLVLTPVESVWRVHETDPDGGTGGPGAGPADTGRELTALLVRYASPLAALGLPRWVNRQAGLQAAQPAFEAARLFHMLGVGADVLRAIAGAVLLVAGLSMFVALYNALEERQADLAILRALGASRAKLFLLLTVQGLLLAGGGAALGWLLGHAGVGLLGLAGERNLPLSAWFVSARELWLIPVALAIGLAASALPALRACRTDIAATLAR